MEKLAIKKSGLSLFGATLAIVFAFSLFLATNVHAEEGDLLLISDPSTCEISGGVWDYGGGGCQQATVSYSPTSGTGAVATTPAAGGEKPPAAVTPSKDCPWWSSPIDCGLLPAVANVGLGLVSGLLKLSGLFLNYAANFTLNLSTYTEQLNINATWSTIRDLMNIVFIFALLWISINTILGLGNDAKKLLASIIISALLINFSLFFTKVVIDASNVVALQFYTGITGGKFITDSGDFAGGGLSDQFMARLKLQSIYDGGQGRGDSKDIGLDFSGVTTIAVMGAIFILITSFVFFIAALMLAARSAVLIILMVTSPIGFIGGFIPKLGKYTEMWRTELINQSLFAPLFFMMIWIVLNITKDITVLTGTGDSATVSFASAIASGGASSISIIFNYVILIAFIIAALNVAKDLSGKAGGAFSKFGATAMGSIAGGAGGWVLRGTAGKAMNSLANSKFMQDMGAKDRFGIGTALHQFTLAGAKSSYDMRAGVPIVGGAAGNILKQAGADVNFGKAGGKGGYKGVLESETKKRKDYGKNLEQKYDFTAARAKIAAGEMTEADMVREAKELGDGNKDRQQVYREKGLPDATIIERMVGKRRKGTMLSMSGAADIEAANQLQKEAFDKDKKSRDKAAIKIQEDKLKRLKRQREVVKDNIRERERIDRDIEGAEKEVEKLRDSVKSNEMKELAEAAAKEAVKDGSGKKEEKGEPKEEK